MLSDITLCKDIAEFAAFALALRGGALSDASTFSAASTPDAETPGPVAAGAEPVEASSGSGMGGKVILVIGAFFLAGVLCTGLGLVVAVAF